MQPASAEYATLKAAGCLTNPALSGLVLDATIEACRKLVWDHFLGPRYFEQGVSAYWLDETDGEGTGGGGDGDHGYDTSCDGGHLRPGGTAKSRRSLGEVLWDAAALLGQVRPGRRLLKPLGQRLHLHLLVTRRGRGQGAASGADARRVGWRAAARGRAVVL